MTLEQQVLTAYAEIAGAPAQSRLFPCGRELAENVGYPPDLLDRLPVAAVEAFCGVGAPSWIAEIEGAVLDLGCGAGLDSLVASQRGGQVTAVDFCPAMLERARRSVPADVRLILASAQELPLADASMDVALVNGLFNLNLERSRIFAELARVLRPGGRAYVSELMLLSEASVEASASNWFT